MRYLVEIEDFGTDYTQLGELHYFGTINLTGTLKGQVETYNYEALLAII